MLFYSHEPNNKSVFTNKIKIDVNIFDKKQKL